MAQTNPQWKPDISYNRALAVRLRAAATMIRQCKLNDKAAEIVDKEIQSLAAFIDKPPAYNSQVKNIAKVVVKCKENQGNVQDLMDAYADYVNRESGIDYTTDNQGWNDGAISLLEEVRWILHRIQTQCEKDIVNF